MQHLDLIGLFSLIKMGMEMHLEFTANTLVSTHSFFCNNLPKFLKIQSLLADFVFCRLYHGIQFSGILPIPPLVFVQ